MSKEEILLRKLRGRLAYKKQVQPYVIFKDTELTNILSIRPKDIETLTTIKGFPRDGKRVAGYGQSIVDIFNRTESVEDFDISIDASGTPLASTVLKRMNLF